LPDRADDAAPPWLSVGRDAVMLRVVARPGAPRAGILRVDPRGPVIGLKSAPERGKANAELIETLARIGGVPRSAVELTAGASARQKSVRIATNDPQGLAKKLRALASETETAR
jgi:uncharacterized protein (TIGR00251 family)